MRTPDWAWATHTPLIKAILDVFPIKLVMEVGIGLHSTPVFVKHNSKPEYIGIEQDSNWMKKVLISNPGLTLIHQDLKGINIATRYWELTPKQKADIILFYLDLKVPQVDGLKVLFVDCFTCSRMYAINTLYNKFDIVVFHDSHPGVLKVYGYDKLKINWNQYQLQSGSSWTTMCIKEDCDALALELKVKEYAKLFAEDWKVTPRFKFIKTR